MQQLLAGPQADVNATDAHETSALGAAVRGHCLPVVKLLLQHRMIDVEGSAEDGLTSLAAVKEGLVEKVGICRRDGVVATCVCAFSRRGAARRAL